MMDAMQSDNAVEILLVEDDLNDAAIVVDTLAQSHRIQTLSDGDTAFQFLSDHANNLPKLVLLDLRLGDADGVDVLKRIRADVRFKDMRVVILTGSDKAQDVIRAYDAGVNKYVIKPASDQAFADAVRSIATYWLEAHEQD
jgi:DNA-binding response OmpR family regulator